MDIVISFGIQRQVADCVLIINPSRAIALIKRTSFILFSEAKTVKVFSFYIFRFVY